MVKKEKRNVTQSVADAMQELEKWMGVDKERSEKVLIVAELIAYGYEVRSTPEEKVKEYFDGWNPTIDSISNSDWTSEQKAIIGTLNRLNIKIKGINE
ncbi:Uncharacterised protein [Lysinibacillus capsici]|uniref:Uncharacterized protein n=1 Tax=Lysinibacillus capsici TaxID=2115968 RepID=A0A2X0ZY68_9BACI|nr:hypothetical protein [Lysinibacillus capsici]SPU37888.1 Uncharacterised protein [Lysinibacillus capsici]